MARGAVFWKLDYGWWIHSKGDLHAGKLVSVVGRRLSALPQWPVCKAALLSPQDGSWFNLVRDARSNEKSHVPFVTSLGNQEPSFLPYFIHQKWIPKELTNIFLNHHNSNSLHVNIYDWYSYNIFKTSSFVLSFDMYFSTLVLSFSYYLSPLHLESSCILYSSFFLFSVYLPVEDEYLKIVVVIGT